MNRTARAFIGKFTATSRAAKNLPTFKAPKQSTLMTKSINSLK